MNKQEAIELLQDVAEEPFENDCMRMVYIEDVVETINQINEPQKPVVPKKQWVVKDETGYLSYLQFSTHNICERETSLDKNDAYKFKSKSKADLFAELVTGTVEEVTDENE